jgi:hypothetical protein
MTMLVRHLMPDKEDDRHPVIERFARWWEVCGEWLKHRPAQVGLIIVGLAATVLVLLAVAASLSAKTDVGEVRENFCNGQNIAPSSEIQSKNCQKLLDKLLKNPTPAQRKRIQEIARETP